MKTFTFDVKMWASFTIRSGTKEHAQRIAEQFVRLLDIDSNAVEGFNSALEGALVENVSVEVDTADGDAFQTVEDRE